MHIAPARGFRSARRFAASVALLAAAALAGCAGNGVVLSTDSPGWHAPQGFGNLWRDGDVFVFTGLCGPGAFPFSGRVENWTTETRRVVLRPVADDAASAAATRNFVALRVVGDAETAARAPIRAGDEVVVPPRVDRDPGRFDFLLPRTEGGHVDAWLNREDLTVHGMETGEGTHYAIDIAGPDGVRTCDFHQTLVDRASEVRWWHPIAAVVLLPLWLVVKGLEWFLF